MSKRKSSMDIDDVMNDINKWLDDSYDEAEDDLNEVNGDKKMKKSFQVNRMLQKMKLILIVMIGLLKIDLSTENSSDVNT